MAEIVDASVSNEQTRIAKERLAKAEKAYSAARDELLAARSYLEGVRAGSQPASPPPVDSETPSSLVEAQEPARVSPTHRPEVNTRTVSMAGKLWLIFALSVVASLALHWVSQIIVGGLVGGVAGMNSTDITASEFDQLNSVTLLSTLLLTLTAAIVNLAITYETLQTRRLEGREVQIEWLGNFWIVVLGGTLLHAIIFGIAFTSAIT